MLCQVLEYAIDPRDPQTFYNSVRVSKRLRANAEGKGYTCQFCKTAISLDELRRSAKAFPRKKSEWLATCQGCLLKDMAHGEMEHINGCSERPFWLWPYGC